MKQVALASIWCIPHKVMMSYLTCRLSLGSFDALGPWTESGLVSCLPPNPRLDEVGTWTRGTQVNLCAAQRRTYAPWTGSTSTRLSD